MGNDARKGRERDETNGVSRRKFLERTGYAGGAAIVAAVNSTCTTAQEGKPQPSPTPQGKAPAQQEAAPQLRGKMVEYKSGDLMIPAYLSRNDE